MTTGWLNTKTKPLLLLVILLLCALIALTNGKYSLTLEELYRLFMQSPVDNPRSSTVFWQIRFPRVFAAIIIGGGLAIAGAAYQGMFRNPLVSPDILGVSAGAGVGAVLGIFLGQSLVSIQLFAFIGGLITVAVVYLIARLAHQHDPILSLVLVGVAISAMCGSAISLMKILADPYTQLPSITFWLLGGLSSITQQDFMVRASCHDGGFYSLIDAALAYEFAQFVRRRSQKFRGQRHLKSNHFNYQRNTDHCQYRVNCRDYWMGRANSASYYSNDSGC
ncbi:Probable ABC transporter permease protein HI_1471 [Providencia alcalifaciens]|nr:Probable ABC transporter permease protein HI_1471 [Providencia alcalifaciens]